MVTINPSVAEEWDFEKNTPDPHEISPNSHRKVSWVCKECGNRWGATIKARNQGAGCPICGRAKTSRNKATPKSGQSLADVRPDLLEEWEYEKNVNLDPLKINPGSMRQVYWKCKKGHSWKASVSKRAIRNQGCPYCYAGTKTSFPEQAIFYYLSKLYKCSNRKKIGGYEFDIYLDDFRIAIEYDGFYWHRTSHAQEMEQRKNDFCSLNTINLFRVKETIDKSISVNINGNEITYLYDPNYTYMDQAIDCLINALESVTSICQNVHSNVKDDRFKILNSYEQHEIASSIAAFPDLVKEWDSERNENLKPENVSPRSEKKVNWICPNGHLYMSRVSHRVSGSGCPICANKIVLKGFNDLATKNPIALEYWDHNKNGSLTPSDVTASSSKTVAWRCSTCGYEWRSAVNKFSQANGCPKCNINARTMRSRKKPEVFLSEFNEKGNSNVILLGSYVNDNTKIRCRCKKCGREWDSLPDNLLRGKGCIECYRNRAKNNP